MHIVRAPAPPGQGGDPPTHRRKLRAHSLTDGEVMRLAAALRHLKAVYGSWGCLGKVMGVGVDGLRAISRGAKRPGINVARLAAKAAGKPLEALFARPTNANQCPLCGRGPS